MVQEEGTDRAKIGMTFFLQFSFLFYSFVFSIQTNTILLNRNNFLFDFKANGKIYKRSTIGFAGKNYSF